MYRRTTSTFIRTKCAGHILLGCAAPLLTWLGSLTGLPDWPVPIMTISEKILPTCCGRRIPISSWRATCPGNVAGEDRNVTCDLNIQARYVRLVVQTWHIHISMRAGIIAPAWCVLGTYGRLRAYRFTPLPQVVTAPGGQYRLCWCAAGFRCSAAEDFKVDFGEMQIIGPGVITQPTTHRFK